MPSVALGGTAFLLDMLTAFCGAAMHIICFQLVQKKENTSNKAKEGNARVGQSG